MKKIGRYLNYRLDSETPLRRREPGACGLTRDDVRTRRWRFAHEKGARREPLLEGFDIEIARRGDLGSENRRAEGRDKAERQEEHRDEPINEPFELYERHDTHFLVSGTLTDVRVFLI